MAENLSLFKLKNCLSSKNSPTFMDSIVFDNQTKQNPILEETNNLILYSNVSIKIRKEVGNVTIDHPVNKEKLE